MHAQDDDTRAFVDLHVPGRSRLGHLRGLDGLRGLAVAGVVAFHAGFDHMVGGYLGVSTFFTLSGFLITSLLLSPAAPGASLPLRGFWGRRIRRLFPASVVTLGLVVALFAPFVATADQLAQLRPDVLASLGNVANWWFIHEGDSYAELFMAPSPVLHFWSLAIEEQFYLVFPVLLWGLWRACRGRAPWLGAAMAALSAALVAWTVLGGLSVDRIYFGTDTRAPELLLGGVLAVLLSRRPLRQRLALRYRWRTVVLSVGAVALAVQLWWWWSLPQDSAWLYKGGFAGYALLTCAVVTAAAIPSGPVYRVCTWGPLRWLGARSYAVYLAHWPLMLAARQLWPEWSRWLTTAVAVAMALLLAELSYRFLERPIRTGRWPSPRRSPAWVAASVVVVVALSFALVPSEPPGQTPDFASDLEDFESFVEHNSSAGSDTTVEVDGPAPAVPVPPVPGVAVYGDSTALGFGMGLGLWSVETGRMGVVPGDLRFGCGVPRYEEFVADERTSPTPECLEWPRRWGEMVAATLPQVAVLISAPWTVPDARLPGASELSNIGDPAVDQFIVSEFVHAVDVLASSGALVVLATWPEYGSWADDGRSDAVSRQTDPVRMARYNELMREVAAQRPDTTAVLEFADWLGPRSQDPTLRADGAHFYPEEFRQLSAEWVGPELERLWQEHWRAHTPQ
jgi:peptidoglycan/LPS O-acetylase OafA/YrhL